MNENIMQVDDILTWCIRVIEENEWTVEDCLAQYPSLQHELEPLLLAALILRQGRDLVPPASFRRVANSRLQLRLQASQRPPEQQTVTFSKHLRFIRQIWILLRQRRLKMATIIAVIALVFSTVFGGVVYAADASGPGDALHGVDLALEDFRLQLTSSDTGLTKLLLRQASERLHEAETELQKDSKTEEIATSLTAFNEIIVQIEALMENGDLTPEQRVEIETAIAALQAARQSTVLSAALESDVEDSDNILDVDSNDANDNDVNENSADSATGNGNDAGDNNTNDGSGDNDNDDDDDNDVDDASNGNDNDNDADDKSSDNDNGDDNSNSAGNGSDDDDYDDNSNSADNDNNDDDYDENSNSADNDSDNDDYDENSNSADNDSDDVDHDDNSNSADNDSDDDDHDDDDNDNEADDD